MRRILCTLLAGLVFCLPAYSQVVLGETVSKAEVDQAQKTVRRAAPQVLKLGIDEFEVIVSDDKLTVPIQWLFEDVPFVGFEEVKAGEVYSIKGRRAGETEVKRHRLPARDKDYIVAWGLGNGTTTMYLNKNGDDAKKIPPQAVSKLKLIAGDGDKPPVPKPDDPVVPVDSELTKKLRTAFATDMVSGKGSKSVALALSDIYAALSRQKFTDVKTIGELNNIVGVAIGNNPSIPAPEKFMTAVRTEIMSYLLSKLNATLNSTLDPLTDERKAAAIAGFAEIAKSLEVLSK